MLLCLGCSQAPAAEACELDVPGHSNSCPVDTGGPADPRVERLWRRKYFFCGRSYPLRRGPSDPLLRRSSQRLHPAQGAGLSATSRTLPRCPCEQCPPFPQLCRVLSCFLQRPLHKQPRRYACRERRVVPLTIKFGPCGHRDIFLGVPPAQLESISASGLRKGCWQPLPAPVDALGVSPRTPRRHPPPNTDALIIRCRMHLGRMPLV